MGQLSTRETVWAIVWASGGNLVEWFGCYIYAFFSVYFAEQFFIGTGQTGVSCRRPRCSSSATASGRRP